ncbi:hypothetical protein PHLCEN_2v5441 [Hermanssonia centrifuga]|uniref:Zn(2)-C6 fungal-type domain-containing protein n=1 Tax=Hermanssonia centrifuga TaxID=98765 RepID=A0A2R6P2F1_9APHY|nr:hypothetical protein PHLCEN_2v5441 [Hermanssonia centrifuga]
MSVPPSRLKKIKCIQPEPNVICEACSNAHVSCRFRDRERYFAERSRAVSGTAPTQSGSMQKSKATHPDQTSSTSSDLRPDDTTHGGVTRSQAHHTPSYHPYRGVANASPITRSGSESEVSTPEPVLGPLFDPKQPNRPMPNLMMTFIQVFFDNLNVYFPFLAYDETFRQFFEQELSPLLANCIAALAVRYAECAEVTERGNMYVTDLYCDKAKVIFLENPSNFSFLSRSLVSHVHRP